MQLVCTIDWFYEAGVWSVQMVDFRYTLRDAYFSNSNISPVAELCKNYHIDEYA